MLLTNMFIIQIVCPRLFFSSDGCNILFEIVYLDRDRKGAEVCVFIKTKVPSSLTYFEFHEESKTK